MKFSKLRLLFALPFILVSCSQDEEEDFTDYEKDKQPVDVPYNINSNSSIKERSASRLEMPHIDASLFYAPHYVEYEGRSIMNLAVEWNSQYRHATWVAFSWDSTTSQDNVSRGSSWKWDPEIPSSYNAVMDKEHASDGFDKGHLCASEDRVYCTEANDQTFYLSNISPQLSSFNQKFWARLEAKVRQWAKMTQDGTIDTIYIVKGGNLKSLLTDFTGLKAGSDKVIPYTNDKGFSKGNMAVPSYYYMALLARKAETYQAIAFYVPHYEDLPVSPTKEDFLQFVVSVDYLEEQTGLDFFCNLPDNKENDIEKNVTISWWKW